MLMYLLNRYYFQYQFKLKVLLRTRSFISNNLIIYIDEIFSKKRKDKTETEGSIIIQIDRYIYQSNNVLDYKSLNFPFYSSSVIVKCRYISK